MDRFLASCREINRFSISKIGPEPAKPAISLALVTIDVFTEPQGKLSLLHLLIWTTVRIGGVITKLMKEAKLRFPCRHFQELYGNSPIYRLQD